MLQLVHLTPDPAGCSSNIIVLFLQTQQCLIMGAGFTGPALLICRAYCRPAGLLTQCEGWLGPETTHVCTPYCGNLSVSLLSYVTASPRPSSVSSVSIHHSLVLISQLALHYRYIGDRD